MFINYELGIAYGPKLFLAFFSTYIFIIFIIEILFEY